MGVNEAGQPVGEVVPDWQARPFPPGVSLRGRYCTVLPLAAEHDDDLAQTFMAMPASDWTYLPAAHPDDDAAARKVLTSMRALPQALPHVVLLGERAAGALSLMRVEPSQGVIEIGWVVMGLPVQRTPASTEAQRLLMGHVFDDLGYRRLEWKCNALNERSRRAATRLGYTFEGVFRQHVVVKGRNRDTAWFSMLDHEWPAQRERLDAWLEPSNFGPDGAQITPL